VDGPVPAGFEPQKAHRTARDQPDVTIQPGLFTSRAWLPHSPPVFARERGGEWGNQKALWVDGVDHIKVGHGGVSPVSHMKDILLYWL
jgi:hypothetical protein